MNSLSIGPPTSTTSLKFRIVDPIAQHDEGMDQEVACDRHFGPRLLAAMHHSVIELLHVRIFPRRLDAGFNEQEAQDSRAGLADPTHALSFARGIFARLKSDVGRHLAAVG